MFGDDDRDLVMSSLPDHPDHLHGDGGDRQHLAHGDDQNRSLVAGKSLGYQGK